MICRQLLFSLQLFSFPIQPEDFNYVIIKFLGLAKEELGSPKNGSLDAEDVEVGN